MPSIELLRPHLHGARFENGEIPLEVLGDLAALREMVLEVAKWRFLQEHPTRQRSPRGFTDNVDLKLTGLERGSAIPIIGLSSRQPALPGVQEPYQEYIEQAMKCIINAVDSPESDALSSANIQMPRKYFAYFDRVGRSLRQGESIEFCFPSGKISAQLDQKKRRNLLAISHIRELTSEVTLRGSVSEMDQDRMTFELQPIYGHKITGPIPEQHRDAIMEALNGYWHGARVIVQGIGKYDRRNRLLSLESVEQIDELDPLDVPAQLDGLRDMRNGWYEGEGLAIPHSGLDWLTGRFERYYPDDMPLPYVYPTYEGGIRMEWSQGANAIILEIDLNTHVGEWLWFDRDSDAEYEKSLALDDATDWVWLASEIRSKATS